MTPEERREYKRTWDQIHRDEINARKRERYREDMQDPARAAEAREKRRARYEALKADPARYAARLEQARRNKAMKARARRSGNDA